MNNDTKQIIDTDNSNYLPVFSRYQIVLERGEGVYLFDSEGKKYLDFLAGIAVNVVGHGYKPLVEAITSQAQKLIHCSNLYYTRPQATAAEKLVKLSGLSRAFFANSGAEANEGAIKIARKYAHKFNPDKSEIISARGSFHGRTLATLTATGQPQYQSGVGPLPEGFSYVRYNDINDLASKINDQTAAVFLETIQGEGGVYPPKDGYLQKVRELCDAHNALLIFDEIQAGIGRSGKFFAYEKYGVKPDIVTLAKGLAGGVPIGAFITTEEVANAFAPGDHGTTFGGNPLACSAANVILDTVPKTEFLNHVEKVGEYFKNELYKLADKYPNVIEEVRGEGLILGAELKDGIDGRGIVNDVLAQGAIINCTVKKVLRFIPPLVIEEKHVDELMPMLNKALAKVAEG